MSWEDSKDEVIAELRQQNAALRAVVRQLAEKPGRLGCHFGCKINERWNEQFPERWGQHSPDCLVSQARAALGE